MSQIRISVAMCTYNGSRFLPEQLASIAAQTRVPDEMIVCDDRSSDATPEILAEFARAAAFPVRIVRNAANLGSTKNFEQAIALCTGDLIALCDQDDIWMRSKLERQAQAMNSQPSTGGVFSDALLIDAASRPIGKRLWEGSHFTSAEQRRVNAGNLAAVLLRQNVVTGATLMFRADLRPLLLPIPAAWVHDGWIAWMLALYSRLAPMAEPLVQYRLHGAQQIGVESVTLGNLSLIERLRKGRDEEPAKHRSAAAEFRELERRLLDSDHPSATLRASVQKKIRFLEERGNRSGNRVEDCLWVLRNADNYLCFEHGWKVLLRDAVLRAM